MYVKINDVHHIDDIWEKDAFVKIKARNKKEIIIEANREGYLSLARLFNTIAENGISTNDAGEPVNDSYWMYNFCGKIDKESSDVVLSYRYNPDEEIPE